MATINFASREITAKLVYFGATGAGSNTNVRQLHRLVPPDRRSRLHKFGPSDTEERSYYFDYVAPDTDAINGFALRYRVYSLPGGLVLEAHRREVIRDVDALVFVADARPGQEAANMDQLLALEEMLGAHGLELASMPIVLQVNHADDVQARRVQDVVYDLNPYGFPVVSAVATEPRGVHETHAELIGALAARIRDNMAGNAATITLTAVHRADAESDDDVIRQHIEAIQEETQATPASGVGEELPTPSSPAPRVELPFQPREFLGTHPLRVVGARIEGSTIEVELLMQPMSGGDPKPLTILLANRPTDTPALARSAPTPATPAQTTPVASYIPDTYDIPEPEGPEFPAWAYAVIGLLGGVAIGALGASLVNLSL